MLTGKLNQWFFPPQTRVIVVFICQATEVGRGYMEECNKYNLACRLMRLITFIDLPIRKKFRLFSFGVLFWFLVMACLTVVGMVGISTHYDRIVNNAVPQDKVVQKVIRNLQAMTIDASNILKAEEMQTISRLQDLSLKRLRDIRDFIAVLALGGEVSDYSHDSARLLETIHTTSLSSDPVGVAFLKELTVLIDVIDKSYTDFFTSKMLVVQGEIDNGKNLNECFNRLAGQIHEASQLSVDFSARLGQLYQTSAEKIHEIIRLTVVAIFVVLFLAILLLLVFTRWISAALAHPISRIIDQIHSVGTGDVDLTNKIDINSQDEIGKLSQEFNKLLDTVYSMSMFKRVIEEDSELADVYMRIAEAFQREAKVDNFVIYEVKDNQREMFPVYPLALAGKEMACDQEILANCDLCRAKKTGHEISSVAYPGICRMFKPETGKNHVCIPLIIGGRSGGVVQFLFDPQGEPAEVQRRIFKAETYIKQSLSVIEAKRLMAVLRESSLKDPLTGLYNRRFLQDHASFILSGVLRRNKNLGLLMCDLDYFKEVNDQHGHDVGDEILKETSALIKKTLRTEDIAIRFGGEEFFVMLMDINPGDAIDVAEKIRKVFDEHRFKVPGGSIQKTLSIGVSEFPTDAEGFWQCIKFADVALYRAKATGRNQAVRFTPDMWTDEQF